MASSSALATALLAVLGCAAAASAATTYSVGDSQGWTTGLDYTTWTNGKTFNEGDKLVFNYASQTHTVTEVPKSSYDACAGSNSISSDSSGPTTVTLTAGTHYYICTVGSHCSSGMKLAVSVGGGGAAGGTPATTPPSGASSRLQAGAAAVFAAAAAAALLF